MKKYIFNIITYLNSFVFKGLLFILISNTSLQAQNLPIKIPDTPKYTTIVQDSIKASIRPLYDKIKSLEIKSKTYLGDGNYLTNKEITYVDKTGKKTKRELYEITYHNETYAEKSELIKSENNTLDNHWTIEKLNDSTVTKHQWKNIDSDKTKRNKQATYIIEKSSENLLQQILYNKNVIDSITSSYTTSGKLQQILKKNYKYSIVESVESFDDTIYSVESMKALEPDCAGFTEINLVYNDEQVTKIIEEQHYLDLDSGVEGKARKQITTLKHNNKGLVTHIVTKEYKTPITEDTDILEEPIQYNTLENTSSIAINYTNNRMTTLKTEAIDKQGAIHITNLKVKYNNQKEPTLYLQEDYDETSPQNKTVTQVKLNYKSGILSQVITSNNDNEGTETLTYTYEFYK